MAYTEFSTKNADYVLQLGNHVTENKHDVFDGIDALVIEGMGIKEKGQLEFAVSHPQMNLPTRKAKNEKIPVFNVDVDAKFNSKYSESILDARDFLANSLSFPFIWISWHYAFNEKRVNGMLGRIFSDINYLLQSQFGEARDAINAKKIEEFVVPKVKEISGKQKPKIGLVYGADHIGLEYDLKSKLRRDFTLWNWRNLNFKKWGGFDLNQLNKIWSMTQNTSKWEHKSYDTTLFN